MQKNKVVGITDVVCHFQIALYKMIERIHVNVDQKLACEIAKRQPNARLAVGMKTPDDFSEEPKNVCIVDVSLNGVEENRMINVGKELSYVAFQHPDGAGMVSGNFGRKLLETIDRAMCAFSFTAGIRVENKLAVEEWIQDSINSMMHEAISNRCLVNISRLRIIDLEGVISTVFIGLLY